MENSETPAKENSASVYRHEPRSLEFLNDQNGSCGCNENCGCNNGNTLISELLFLLSLWKFLSQPRTNNISVGEQRVSEQSEEPSC